MIAVPIASNASEFISSVLFARRKRKKELSLIFSMLYGGVVMNNALCLGVFLLLLFCERSRLELWKRNVVALNCCSQYWVVWLHQPDILFLHGLNNRLLVSYLSYASSLCLGIYCQAFNWESFKLSLLSAQADAEKLYCRYRRRRWSILCTQVFIFSCCFKIDTNRLKIKNCCGGE